jgi:hypothetical protein
MRKGLRSPKAKISWHLFAGTVWPETLQRALSGPTHGLPSGISPVEVMRSTLPTRTCGSRRLRRGPQDAPRDIQVTLAPSGSRRVIPFAATVLRSLALLRYRSRASSHNDLTPLRGYRGLLASVFDLPWLVERPASAKRSVGAWASAAEANEEIESALVKSATEASAISERPETWCCHKRASFTIAPRPSGCATGHPSPPGALGLAASDSFCRDRPALTCATSLSLARKLTQ